MNKKIKFMSSIALAGILASSSLTGIVAAATTTNTERTTAVGVFNKLVSDTKNVVPYIVNSRNDRVTISDVKADFSNITRYNGTTVASDTTVVSTGDTFVADGVTYTVLVYGDVDKNGSVNSLDALEVEKYRANKTNKIGTNKLLLEAADVNGNGSLDSVDSLNIKKLAADKVGKTYAKAPEQEVQDNEVVAFRKEAEATLKDYDAALKSLEEDRTITTQEYESILQRIEDAIADMKKATTLEAAQEIYDEIEADVLTVADEDKETFDTLVETVKEAREAEQKRVTEALNKYVAVAETMEDLTAHDKGVINRLVADALQSVNNAKTAQEVIEAENIFEGLLVSGNYTDLAQEVARQTAILQAQKDAYKILDAYEATLNGMTNFADKDKVKVEIATARRNVMNAKSVSEIGEVTTTTVNPGIIKDFVDFVDRYYKDMTKPSSKKLIEDTLAEALATLDAYKTGAYANEVTNPEADEEDQITVADLVDDYVEDLQEKAESLLASPKTHSYKSIESDLNTDTTALDRIIKEIKKTAEANREAYLEAYKVAMEELEVYAENAEVFNLTDEQLSYVNSLISNTEGKIKEVDTALEVRAAMTVFRNAVAEYYADFDQYQVEEIKKIAVAKLEEYKDLTDAIDDLVDDGIAEVKKQTSVNGIQTELQEAIDAINAAIKADELATAKVEARAQFYDFLEEADIDSKYSEEVHDLASKAIDEINKSSNSRDVNNQVDRYMGLIEEQLEEEGTSLKAEIKEAQEEAKKDIALYKELAEISDEEELIDAIEAYEDSIMSENATLGSIAKDRAALKEHIETFENQIIVKKLDAIEYITKGIGDEYISKATYDKWYGHLDKYCSEDGILDYYLLTDEKSGDPYVIRTFEKAITAIKNATKEADLEIGSSDSTMGTLVKTQRTNIVNAVKALDEMKAKAETYEDAIIAYAGETLGISGLTNSASLVNLDTLVTDSTLNRFLKGFFADYLGEIDDVQYDAYLSDGAEVFEEIVARAEKAIDNYIKGEITKEAKANLGITNVYSKLQEAGSAQAYGRDVKDYQKNISVSSSGAVKGDIRYVSTYTGYSSATPSGYFVTLPVVSNSAKSIVIRRYNGTAEEPVVEKKMEDNFITIRFEDENDTKNTTVVVEFYDEEDVDEETTGKTPVQTITYNFSNLKLHDYDEFVALPETN